MLKPLPPADDPSIGELTARLIDEGKTYLGAEANLAQVKVKARLSRFGRAAELGGAALLFGLAALMALAVTLVIGLAHLLGPFGGGLLAVAIFAVPAIALAYAAKRSIGPKND
ncbi:MAG: phage holin family protein [Sphingomicrobium sp.]